MHASGGLTIAVNESIPNIPKLEIVNEEANPPEPQPQAPGQPQGGPAGAQAGDPTGAGGGTIGTGSVPTPGEPGFSANTGEGAA